MKLQFIFMFLGPLILSGCDRDEFTFAEKDTVESREVSANSWGDWGVQTGYIDDTVSPGDDFFKYVNGKWYDNFEIPDDKTSYGTFHLLGEKSRVNVRSILDGLISNLPPIDKPEGKVARFYSSYLNQDRINQHGMEEAEIYLNEITKIDNLTGLSKLFARPEFFSPVDVFVAPDDRDPNTYITQLYLADLIMPDRDYYLASDGQSPSILSAYKKLIMSTLVAAGYASPDEVSLRILTLETTLAKAAWDRTAAQNPEITYNKLSPAQLKTVAPTFPLKIFLEESGVGSELEVLVYEMPPTDKELNQAGLNTLSDGALGGGVPAALETTTTVELETWKAYLAIRFLLDNAAVIDETLDHQVFDFQGTELRGVPIMRPRWQRGISSIQRAMGDALGAAYVDRFFPPENKIAVETMVSYLSDAMEYNISELDWMSDTTKLRALEKLRKFSSKIGYPETFDKYRSFIVSNSALENALETRRYLRNKNLKRLGTAIDRSEWLMPPQRVGAYYYGAHNEIVFPAAILQPPFFNAEADAAVNYGAIGAIIGHEMGHGFDDLGAKYDGDGRLMDWWASADFENFQALGEKLIDQYNQYCPLDDGKTCINGRLTLGENIGDLGGLSLAYRAYHLSLNGKKPLVIDGFTGDQRFFLAWAQAWRFKYREETLRNDLLTDPHSPAQYRVNGIVRNMDEWYRAFNVDETNRLYLPPEERVQIW